MISNDFLNEEKGPLFSQAIAGSVKNMYILRTFSNIRRPSLSQLKGPEFAPERVKAASRGEGSALELLFFFLLVNALIMSMINQIIAQTNAIGITL